jgi:ABC-type transport system substrate-binding protein
VAATGPRQVRFTLTTPLGGFLQALTQPIAPAHLLGDVPIASLADDPFGERPVGSGPFVLTDLTATSASLVPADSVPGVDGPSPTAGASPDSLTTPAPTIRPSRPVPYLAGIEFRFYADVDALVRDFRAGVLDGASGLPAAVVGDLGATDGVRLVRYPGSTLTAVLLNLRPGNPEFSSPSVRTGLLAALDRAKIGREAFAGLAAAATGPIPAVSPMFDATADPVVPYSRGAAETALKAADWTKGSKGWSLPGAKTPLSLEVLSPTEASNPGLYATAGAIVSDWQRIGLIAKHVALPPGEFVGEKLSTGSFQVAVADLRVGLDPDLYPLLASSQTLTGGSNVIGVQSSALDTLLERARKPGSETARKAAYSALQKQLATGRYLLPIAFADEVLVLRDTVQGPTPRQVTDGSDRFWDVLTWRLAVDR